MAEAVFAGEEVEELTLYGAAAVLTFALAKLAWLPEHLLVGDGPRGTGNGDGEKKEKRELVREREGQHKRLGWRVRGHCMQNEARGTRRVDLAR